MQRAAANVVPPRQPLPVICPSFLQLRTTPSGHEVGQHAGAGVADGLSQLNAQQPRAGGRSAAWDQENPCRAMEISVACSP
jgi:hypothetical protein